MARFGRKSERDASAGGHDRTRALERVTVRIAMTLGVIGIGTALAAILGTQEVDAWIVGLVVSTVSVVLGLGLLRDLLDDLSGLRIVSLPRHVGLRDDADELVAIDDWKPADLARRHLP